MQSNSNSNSITNTNTNTNTNAFISVVGIRSSIVSVAGLQSSHRYATYLCYDFMSFKDMVKLRMTAKYMVPASSGTVFWQYLSRRQESENNAGRTLFLK